MREDCFGCSTANQQEMVGNVYPHCKALKRTYCSDPNVNCPFYKPFEQWRQEVLRNNGTDNFRSMVSRYSEKHGGS